MPLIPLVSTADSYKVTGPSGTDLANLDLERKVSEGADYNPKGSQNFSNNSPVKFTVTAEDGTENIYCITVEKPSP